MGKFRWWSIFINVLNFARGWLGFIIIWSMPYLEGWSLDQVILLLWPKFNQFWAIVCQVLLIHGDVL